MMHMSQIDGSLRPLTLAERLITWPQMQATPAFLWRQSILSISQIRFSTEPLSLAFNLTQDAPAVYIVDLTRLSGAHARRPF
jgi:hypothetical protein